MRNYLALACALAVCAIGFVFPVQGLAQSLGNAGTVQGTVVDTSGGVVAGAEVSIKNAISCYNQTTRTGTDGSFRLTNIPPNPYHLEVAAAGFSTFSQDVSIRSGIPIQVKAPLPVAGVPT